MKDKWLNDFRDRVSDFEMDPPDGLWESIAEKEMAPAGSGRKRVIPVWGKRCVAAAAVVAVVVTALYLLRQPGMQLPSLAVADLPKVDKPATSPTQNVMHAATRIQTTTLSTKTVRGAAVSGTTITKYESSETESPISESEEASVISETSSSGSETTGSMTDNAGARFSSESSSGRQYIDNSIQSSAPDHKYPVKHHEKRGINLSVHTNGLLASGDRPGQSFHNPGYLGPTGSDNTDPENPDQNGSDTRGATAATRSGSAATKKMHHHRPIRVGASILWMVNNRFGLGTGISYTYLSSEFNVVTPLTFSSGEQTLHYIGIPVNAYFNIVRWKRISVYASAGVLAEKCVSAKLKSEGLSENMETYSTTSNINEHPFQLSANLSAGIEWNFAGNFGIYLEPGVSYYFKDNSDLQTFYKEHPFDFNLNLGIRFTIGH